MRFGATIRIGDVIADKYEVTKLLGVGGMGMVVAAHHRELDRLVALKFIHEDIAANAGVVDRFLLEARAAARLRNEHVGRVLDVSRLPSGVPYIVMEYLDGHDLWQLCEQRGALPIGEAVDYVIQACEAMAEAHAIGIVHRDLKPQNLFLTRLHDGRALIKVLDFGISKAQHAAGPTATGQTMGTPAYMAPEQMRSARCADARADIWSLGVILYQLLAGTLPFAGDSVAETMLKVMTEPAASLSAARPDVPPELARIVERCLVKDREQRTATVAELVRELAPFASSTRIAPLSPVAVALKTQPTTLGSAVSAITVSPAKRRSRLLAIPLFVTTIFAAAVALVILRDPEPQALDAPIPAVDAAVVVIDAAIEPIVLHDAAIDAAPDAAVDAPRPASVRPRPAPPKLTAVDAGTPPAPDAFEMTTVGD